MKLKRLNPTSQVFVRILHNRIAELAVGPSALRSQGAKGVVATARIFFKNVDPAFFIVSSEREFYDRLNKTTDKLQLSFPCNAQHWGAARKGINLFLRDVLYNTVLSRYYHMERIEHWLEIPLDRDVASGINHNFSQTLLPKWQGIKHLTPEMNTAYQDAALDIAGKKQIARVHLDLLYWRRK